MIKCNKGIVEIEGRSFGEIEADLTTLIKATYEIIAEKKGETYAKQRIETVYKRAFMSKEELIKELLRTIGMI